MHYDADVATLRYDITIYNVKYGIIMTEIASFHINHINYFTQLFFNYLFP